MVKIKIKDLPENTKISEEEMKQIAGGTTIYKLVYPYSGGYSCSQGGGSYGSGYAGWYRSCGKAY